MDIIISSYKMKRKTLVHGKRLENQRETKEILGKRSKTIELTISSVSKTFMSDSVSHLPKNMKFKQDFEKSRNARE
jgi:hypothetical protein